MDLVALHVTVSDLIFYALLFLEEYDCETVGE
jgi:mediator of RNA polymerase II transcription subunit 5